MTNWSKEELLAYILIWSANANFIEDEAEIELIQSKVDESVYKTLKREFSQDNDSQRIEKVTSSMEQLNYSKEDKDQIFQDIKEMFNSDGDFDTLEQNLYRGFKMIFT